ncbi:unknown [Bacteroides thetaiotaomicron CAG:40]|nr:unknown [Bacteroides thetaiotaomicron CAG:40]
MLKKGGNKNYPVFPTIFISIFAENKPQNSKTYDRN